MWTNAFVCVSIFCFLQLVNSNPVLRNEADKLMPTSMEYLRLGEVMDIDDDRIIVGNYVLDEALIFKNEHDVWKQEAKLNVADGGRSYFGRSVGIKGRRAVVGALHDNISKQKNSGSVYIFTYVNSTWIPEVKLVPSDPGWYFYFGYSVALDNDHVVVGCPYYGGQSGAVYIFKRIKNVWKQQIKLLPSDAADFNIFGHSVAIDGRYVVVGTLHNNGNKDVLSGAAYVFKQFGHSWYQQMKIHPEKKLRDYTDDEFGYSIAIRNNHIIVGCPGDEVNGVSSGAAYIYKNKGRSWVKSVKIFPSDGVSNDYFGSSVDITEGFVVVGGRRGHYNGSQPGTAYIFQQLGNEWIQRSKLIGSDRENDANFGFTVVINQNFTIVGCPWCKKEDKVYRGSAYIFNNIDEMNN